MNKNFRQLLCSLCLSFLLCVTLTSIAYAENVSVSFGSSQVAVGNTVSVSITVPGDADAWAYNVSYSGGLDLVSGDTAPMGFSGDNRTNTLIFRAASVGTGYVEVYGANGISINGSDRDISGSASVDIVSVSSSTGGSSSGSSSSSGSNSSDEDDAESKSDSRSGNSSLAELSLSTGTLSPAFAPDITEYQVELTSKTTSLTVTATPSDSKATVSGAGEISLKPGENTITVTATAENGDSTPYTIHAYVAETPTVFLDLDGAQLGVVKDVSRIKAPDSFIAATVAYGEETLPAWQNEAKTITLLYLIDPQDQAGFYAYSEADGVLDLYQVITCGGATYYYAGIPAEQRQIPGLTYGPVNAFDKSLHGFIYDDPHLQSWLVLYLMDEDGNFGYYTYDPEMQSLQRFSGAVKTMDTKADSALGTALSALRGGVAIPLLGEVPLYVLAAAVLVIALLLFYLLGTLVGKHVGKKKALRNPTAQQAVVEPLEQDEEDIPLKVEMAEEPDPEAQPPVESEIPTEPEFPAELDFPVETYVPAEPEISTEPEAPAEPKLPAEPEVPAEPPHPEKDAIDEFLGMSLDDLLNDIKNM